MLTPLNVIFIILSISVFFVTIFFCMMLYHLIQVLKETEEVIDKANNTVDQVNEYIAKPLMMAMEITKKVRYFVNMIQKRIEHAEDEEEGEEEPEDK